MEFGLLTGTALDIVDFTLPQDGLQTTRILAAANPKEKPQFFVGCAKWGRKEWVGLIYPPKTKEADFLEAYTQHFNSIELNATFYNIPKEEQVMKWKAIADKLPGSFIFCPKFSQPITHLRRLKNAEAETDAFLAGINAFGSHLGPCFLQLSDNFGPKNFDVLQNYLHELPKDLHLFVELRHKEWFNDPVAKAEVFAMLAAEKKGAVITDASGRRDCVHMELTTSETFIRFVGNGKKKRISDDERIDAWAERIR
ncbi:MAG: DUF72 domain-containing protein, partial [Pedobacter sp.]